MHKLLALFRNNQRWVNLCIRTNSYGKGFAYGMWSCTKVVTPSTNAISFWDHVPGLPAQYIHNSCPEFGSESAAVWQKRMLGKICDFKPGGCTEAKRKPRKQTGIGSQNGCYHRILWKRVDPFSILDAQSFSL